MTTSSPVVDTAALECPQCSILLAEDNLINQKIAVRLLNRLGLDVDVAGDGYEVLEKLRHRSYDVILMDMRMPFMDGLETCRRIREERTILQPQIIALTANSYYDAIDLCIGAGMDGFLTKPFTLETLQAALCKALSQT